MPAQSPRVSASGGSRQEQSSLLLHARGQSGNGSGKSDAPLDLTMSLSKNQLDRIASTASGYPIQALPMLGTPSHDMIVTHSHDLDHALHELVRLLQVLYASQYNASLSAFETGILHKDHVAYKLELLTHLVRRQLHLLPQNKTLWMTLGDFDRVGLFLATIYTSTESAMVATFGSDGAFVCMPDVRLADWLCATLDRVRALLARGDPLGRPACIMLSRGKYVSVADTPAHHYADEREHGEAIKEAVRSAVVEAREAASRSAKAAHEAAKAAEAATRAAAAVIELFESYTHIIALTPKSDKSVSAIIPSSPKPNPSTKRKQVDFSQDKDQDHVAFTQLVRQVIDLAGEHDDEAINRLLVDPPAAAATRQPDVQAAKRVRGTPKGVMAKPGK